MKTKKCTTCGDEKELNEFYKSKNGRDGHKGECNKCCCAYSSEYRRNHPPSWNSLDYKMPKTKICNACHSEKNIDDFYKDKSAQDGHGLQCKQCEHNLHKNTPKLKVNRKRCYRCREEREISEFHKNKWRPDGHNGICKMCISIENNTPEKRRKDFVMYLRREYNIEIDDYNEILKRQGGLCAICKKAETVPDGKTGKIRALGVDHNHMTGEIRELLCHRCNTMISCEIPDLLRAGADYIEKWNPNNAPR